MLHDGYEAIIGLECHAQLRTASKMFCACPVVNDAPPNSAVCPTCLAHPGTLPVLNDRAVKLGLRAALATGCTLHDTSVFARKHYFYPDLPKGYQISQFDRPLATGGAIHALGQRFGITRIHLEEDAGKMTHAEGGSTVDWNRAGVPLIEIVSEAHMRSAEQAEAYLRTLHRVLVESGICTGDMEKGHFRCDANVSVHRPGEPWGTKVEVKNVNSFRFVAKAIRFEIERQVAVLQAGGTVDQETRTWAGKGTVTLRKKEGSADYRYFPDPDLGPLVLEAGEIEAQRATLPGLPMDLFLAQEDERRVTDWVENYGLSTYDVTVILGNPEAAAIFMDAVAAGGAPKAMANWVTSEVLRREDPGQISGAALSAVQALVDDGTINRDGAKRVIEVIAEEGGDPAEIVSRLGLGQVSDEGKLAEAVASVLAAHPAELAKYRAGNKGLFGFFMGKLMAATGRKAEPGLAQRLLRGALDGTPG
ncbi:MAG: Asp-tRNA(Asn)/Glu-tRNA(Gln) amidotransferase subunit GatB [Deltaproteobacteria bacterium]|nr:Asp-tRNA(Asn)/Glu-tRNA(Gln) amidotransferase subunit GatB [Deltaproteobacteria bacterium]